MATLNITASAVAPVRVIEQFTGPAGEVITAGQFVRFNTTTGHFELGNGTTAGEGRRGGIAIKSAPVIGMAITVVTKGIVDLGNALGSLTYDDDVFLSNTDGVLGDAAGSVSYVVGVVVPGFASLTPDKLLAVGSLG
jgi:hypothetical protein